MLYTSESEREQANHHQAVSKQLVRVRCDDNDNDDETHNARCCKPYRTTTVVDYTTTTTRNTKSQHHSDNSDNSDSGGNLPWWAPISTSDLKAQNAQPNHTPQLFHSHTLSPSDFHTLGSCRWEKQPHKQSRTNRHTSV